VWDASGGVRRAAADVALLLPEQPDVDAGKSAAPARDARARDAQRQLARRALEALYTLAAVRSAAQSCAAQALKVRLALPDSSQSLAAQPMPSPAAEAGAAQPSQQAAQPDALQSLPEAAPRAVLLKSRGRQVSPRRALEWQVLWEVQASPAGPVSPLAAQLQA